MHAKKRSKTIELSSLISFLLHSITTVITKKDVMLLQFSFFQFIFFIIISVYCFLSATPSGFSQNSNTITIEWAPNLEKDLAGYKVYQGKNPGQYGYSSNVGLVNTYTVSNIDPTITTYFAVTAYDNAGNESVPSSEVFKKPTLASSSTFFQPHNRSLLFSQDFLNTNLAGWRVVDIGTIGGPSTWDATTGALVQHSNIFGGSIRKETLPKPGSQLVYEKGRTWTDYSLSFKLRSEDDDALGVFIRYQDPDNFYRLSWDRSREYRRIIKAVNGVYTILAEDSTPYVTGQTYKVNLEITKTNLHLQIDGTPVFNVNDDNHTAGTIGFYSWGNQGSWFDDIQVESR